jgi:rod shape-determining protein MreD
VIAERGSWVIVGSILIALLLVAIPVPVSWREYTPDWPLLFLFYWVLALPNRVGVLSACVVGILTDLLDGSPAGATAIGAVMAVLVILVSYQRIRQFDGLKQGLVMVLLISLVHLIEQRLETFLGWQHASTAFLMPAAVSFLFWVPVRNCLRFFRRYYEVQ